MSALASFPPLLKLAPAEVGTSKEGNAEADTNKGRGGNPQQNKRGRTVEEEGGENKGGESPKTADGLEMRSSHEAFDLWHFTSDSKGRPTGLLRVTLDSKP